MCPCALCIRQRHRRRKVNFITISSHLLFVQWRLKNEDWRRWKSRNGNGDACVGRDAQSTAPWSPFKMLFLILNYTRLQISTVSNHQREKYQWATRKKYETSMVWLCFGTHFCEIFIHFMFPFTQFLLVWMQLIKSNKLSKGKMVQKSKFARNLLNNTIRVQQKMKKKRINWNNLFCM